MPPNHRHPWLVALLLTVTLDVGTMSAWTGDKSQPKNEVGVEPLFAGMMARLGQPPIKHSGAVRLLAFSADGKTLFSAGAEFPPALSVWDLASGQELHRHIFDNDETVLAISPERKILATCHPVSGIILRDTATGKFVRRFGLPAEPGAILVAEFSPDGKTLAAGNDAFKREDGGRGDWADTLRLYDVESGKEIRRWSGKDALSVTALAFSANGKMLVTCGDLGSSLWNVATGNRLHRWPNKARYVAFAPDSKSIAMDDCPDKEPMFLGGSDTSVLIRDVATGNERARVHDLKETALLHYLPDGKTLIVSPNGSGEYLIDPDTGRERRRLIADRLGAVRAQAVFGADPARARQRQHARPHGDTAVLAVSLDGKLLAAGKDDGFIFLWDVHSGKQLLPAWQPKKILTMAFSYDGQPLAGGVDGRDFVLWDAKTCQELRRLPFWEADVVIDVHGIQKGKFVTHLAMNLSADGRFLAADQTTALVDDSKEYRNFIRTIRVMNLGTGKEVQFPMQQDPDMAFLMRFIPPHPPVFSPDGKAIAWREGASLRLMNSANGKTIASMPRAENEASLLHCTPTWSPDGKRIALVGVHLSLDSSPPRPELNGVRIWEIETGNVSRPFNFPGHALAFSPDGKMLVGDNNGAIWIGAWQKGNLLLRGRIGQEGQAEISCMAFAPDGRRLATSDASTAEIQVWDVVKGVKLRRLFGHKSPVHALVFAPDGRSLLSRSEDATAILWNVTN